MITFIGIMAVVDILILGINRHFKTHIMGFGVEIFYKCYGVNVPFAGEGYEIASILIDGKIFPKTNTPAIRPSEGKHILTIFHYPNQLIHSVQNMNYIWPTRKSSKSFSMKFQIEGVEVLSSRNKPTSPCNPNWKHYDADVLLQHVTDVGCRAPYQLLDKNVPICSTEEKKLEAMMPLDMNTKKKYPPPCRRDAITSDT